MKRNILFAIVLIVGGVFAWACDQLMPTSVSAQPIAMPLRSFAYIPLFGDQSPKPSEIDYTAFTDLIIFTTEPDQNPPNYFREEPGDANLSYFDNGYSNHAGWAQDMVTRAHAKGVKVEVCLGGEVGGNHNSMTVVLRDPAKRAAYISYVTKFAHDRNFDGFNLDDEFTGSGDAGNLRAFFTELRAANPTAVITTAVPIWGEGAYSNEAAFYNGNDVDFILIMAYRQSDGSGITGFNSPIYTPVVKYPNYSGGCWLSKSTTPNGVNPQQGQGIKDGWINKGIHANKMGMIIPFEMAKVDGNDAPGQSRSGWVQFANYSSIVAALKTGVVEQWDNEAKVPWIGFSDGSGKHYYSYENQQSIYEKIKVCKDLGLGALGIWELFRGYARNATTPDELLQWFKAANGGIVAPPIVTPPPVIPPTPTPTPPPVVSPAVTISTLTPTIKLGDSATVNVTGNFIANFVDRYPDSVYYSTLTPTKGLPAVFTFKPSTLGRHIFYVVIQEVSSGKYYTSNTLTFNVISNPGAPPPPACNTDSLIKVGVGIGYAQGRASIDSSGIYNFGLNAGFDNGWNACVGSLPKRRP